MPRACPSASVLLRADPSTPGELLSFRDLRDLTETPEGAPTAGSTTVACAASSSITGSGKMAGPSSIASVVGRCRVAGLESDAAAVGDGNGKGSDCLHPSATPTVKAAEATPTVAHLAASAHGAAVAAAAEPDVMDVAASPAPAVAARLA